MSRGSIAAAGLAVLVVALVAGALLRRLAQRGVRRFPCFAAPLPEADYAALAQRPGWQARVLEVAPGVVLRGLVRPARSPGAPAVLFFSGNADRQLAQGQAFIEALDGAQDSAAAVFAFRGYDGSSGTPTVEALRGDGARVYAQLRQGEWREAGSLHVVGFSLGTGVASATAAREGPPASLTLLAPFTELALVQPSPFARLLPGALYDARPDLARVRCPTLVVHGTADDSLPVAMGRAVQAQLGDRARLLEVPGAGHLDLLADARALRAVRDFIQAHHEAHRSAARATP